MSDEEFKVGYGKPPQATRFQKNVSGNPKGRRPKQAMNPRQIMDLQIRAKVNGEMTNVPAAEAVLMKFFEDAMKGDNSAARTFLKQSIKLTKNESNGNNAPIYVRGQPFAFDVFDTLLVAMGIVRVGIDDDERIPAEHRTTHRLEIWALEALLKRNSIALEPADQDSIARNCVDRILALSALEAAGHRRSPRSY